MQKNNVLFIFVSLLCLSLMSGCEVVKHKSPPHKRASPSQPPTPLTPPPATPLTPPSPPLQDKSFACYLNTCFETISMKDIKDAGNNYDYPNSDNFSDETLRPQYIKPTAVLDLHNIDPDIKIAPNFKLVDFMSAQKGQYGLFSSDVVSIIQFIRNAVNRPVFVTSGYRSPGYNRSVSGSASWSRHTYGDGLDFYIQGMEISELPEFCKRHNASFTLTYPRHIHCDWRRSKLDPAFYESTAGEKTRPLDAQVNATAKMISEQSRIIYKAHNNQIELSTQLPIHEAEEGVPTHNWKIKLPSGQVTSATTPTVYLNPSPGLFYIQVTVGGSIELEDVLQW